MQFVFIFVILCNSQQDFSVGRLAFSSSTGKLYVFSGNHFSYLNLLYAQQICMKLFFKDSSAAEIGATCASVNQTGKSDAKKGPEKDYNAYRDFTDREKEAHIVARWMTFVGMASLEGIFN